ncbi:MAG: RecQ family ATP-dependent DNA helicase [Prevotella sp.]|nr:RecQ family ATP-dependent DNA helicase [Prevotella sp.]
MITPEDPEEKVSPTDGVQGNHNSQFSILNSQLLKKYWGYDDFRGIQREIIESISSGHDTLGLMPTGGGKSITFQVPALAMEGTCIVITPLIALMKDQVQNLRRRGIRAAAIYSGLSHDKMLVTLENAVFGMVKLLYVSPERLSSELFLTKLRHMKVSFICVDEAHCISQWGYDFRPSYLKIADIRRELPHVAVLALTATAPPAVVDDIQQRLRLPASVRSARSQQGEQVPAVEPGAAGFNVFRMSFERKNLAYVVRRVTDKFNQLVHILNHVSGSAIVYARSRRRTKEYAEQLQKQGISAIFYHAGLDDAEKDRRQQAWQRGEVRVMVATNAFGMGIDKPDVRLVAHIDCPSSIEAYFQEAGRAGRDGKKAYAVLITNSADVAKLQKRIGDTFPPKDYVRRVYDSLAYFYQVGLGSGYNATFEFPIDKFCYTYGFFPVQVESALHILNRAGYIEYSEETESRARVRFCLERDDLYRLQSVTPDEDRVIISLLRTYSGLFSDYQYIDEVLLAQLTGLTLPQVYLILKGLAQRRIISFIPQKRTPYVRYMQRREESRHLMFPKAVYDDLKQRFTERVQAMIAYATDDRHCRSRHLLRYFGEASSHDCGQCDVCLDHDEKKADAEYGCTEAEARAQILAFLADGKAHPAEQLLSLRLPMPVMEKALAWLVKEEAIIDDDGLLQLP